jgi:transposase
MAIPSSLRRCLAALDEDSTLIAVIEMSQSSWLVVGVVPGVERHPVKKLELEETKRRHCCAFCVVGALRRRRPAA